MSIEFEAAMRRAAEAVRSLDPAGATRIIREALGTRDPQPEPAVPETPAARAKPAAPKRRQPSRRRRAASVEDAEIVAPPGGRHGLGDVVRSLREHGLGDMLRRAPRAPRPMPEIPEGAEIQARSHAAAGSSRAFRLYIPASAKRKVRGLVVMLHGCTQNPEDFAAGTRMNALAEAHGLLVAWPEQAQAHNPNACWNWFRPEHQGRGAGEPAIIAGLTAALVEEFDVPRGRVFVAGLSAGGAMAAVLGEAYPELFAAVGVHSGLACGTAHDVPSALAAMRGAPAAARPLAATAVAAPRLIVFQGAADSTVHAMNAGRLVARAAALAGARPRVEEVLEVNDRRVARSIALGSNGAPAVELWMIDGAGHAWSGGSPDGSYADARGPDASAEMLRFFLGR